MEWVKWKKKNLFLKADAIRLICDDNVYTFISIYIDATVGGLEVISMNLFFFHEAV